MPRATLNLSRGHYSKGGGFKPHSPKHDSRIETDPENPDYKVVEVIREKGHMRQRLANGNINDYFGEIQPSGREGLFPDDMGYDYFESNYYVIKFRKFRDKLNEGRRKNRNKEIDSEYMRKSRNYCPEQVIFQVGKYDGEVGKYVGVSPELLETIHDEFLKWRKEEYPLVECIDRSIHKDEASFHIQEHDAYTYHEKDEEGNEICLGIGQGKCLDEMGVPLPPPEYLEALKEQGKGKSEKALKRYINSKTTYTMRCREKMQEICLEHGVELITEGVEHPGQTLVAYKAEQIKKDKDRLDAERAALEADRAKLKTKEINLNDRENELKTTLDGLKADLDEVKEILPELKELVIKERKIVEASPEWRKQIQKQNEQTVANAEDKQKKYKQTVANVEEMLKKAGDGSHIFDELP